MAQYLAPGVYVEEVPSGIKPISGVGTSTAGFVGAVADDVTMPVRPGGTPDTHYLLAPEHEARLITSWEAFTQTFGDLQFGNLVLAHAVYGFFNNGGSRCWVARVAAPAPSGDHPDAPDVDTVAVSSVTAALETFKAIDEIAVVAVPGATTDDVQNAVLDHCENPHLQDRFAVLDGRRTTEATRDAVQGGTRDSSYGAIYHPWLQVYDPVSNARLTVPPSGYVAGVFARVDTERGVHKAPANEVIRGALDVVTAVSREDQAGLNPEDINVIRRFGGNVTIFGARTLAGKEDPEWRYVSVRRLFLFLRDSINAGVQWTVFEPNDAALWGKLRRNVGAFLTNVWRSGALVGATPQEAFFVRCDETLNPPEVQALGQVVVEIGVAVVRPAEFVIFRISQWAGPAAAA
ncbi:MAG: phage tail sheath family protein [Blastococcus sp.]